LEFKLSQQEKKLVALEKEIQTWKKVQGTDGKSRTPHNEILLNINVRDPSQNICRGPSTTSMGYT
jgi:hypothetical protein